MVDINTDAEYWKKRAYVLVMDPRFQIAAAIFLLALLPRVMFMEHGLWQDEGRAMSIARNLLQGEGMHYHNTPPAQHPFTFYFLLAASFLVAGATDVTGTVLVAVLGALTAVVVFLVGEELYNKYAGIAAGLLLVFSPIFLSISNRVLNDVPVTFFMTLASYLFLISERRDNKKLFYIAVIATGVAALTKISALILPPIFALYTLHKRGDKAFWNPMYWKGAAVFAAMFATWEIRNRIVLGETAIIRRGLSQFGFIATSKDFSVGVGTTDTWFYAMGLHEFLGFPAYVFFLIGLVGVFMYEANRREVVGTVWFKKGAVAAITVGVIGGYVKFAFMEFVSFAFFVAGIVFIFTYVKDRSAFPLLFLLAVFELYTLKTYNLFRYALPFVPMAMVVAGFGAERVMNMVNAVAGRKAAIGSLALLLSVSLYMMAGPGVARLQQDDQSFVGLEEAGQWLNANTAPEDEILATSINQVTWYSDRDNIEELYSFQNASALDAYVRQNNVKFIELDPWERLLRMKASYAPQHLQQSSMYRPAEVIRIGDQAGVVIYQVTQ